MGVNIVFDVKSEVLGSPLTSDPDPNVDNGIPPRTFEI